MTSIPSRPADFDAYWGKVAAAVDAIDPAPHLVHTPLRSTPFSTAYDLHLSAPGPYRIFGFLSIPDGDGPFPAILNTPRYGSVNGPPSWDDRQRYVVLTLMHRGQRLADTPYKAAYPGLLTDGIQDPEAYIYRDIVADCMVGARYLQGFPQVDRTRVAAVGDDLALITAARVGGFNAVAVGGLMFYRLMEAAGRTDAYPIEEINDELRLVPGSEAAIAGTVSYMDPIHHAAGLSARTLLHEGDPGKMGGPEWLDPLATAIGDLCERYRLSHEGGTDHDALDAWLAAALEVPALPRLWEAAR